MLSSFSYSLCTFISFPTTTPSIPSVVQERRPLPLPWPTSLRKPLLSLPTDCKTIWIRSNTDAVDKQCLPTALTPTLSQSLYPIGHPTQHPNPCHRAVLLQSPLPPSQPLIPPPPPPPHLLPHLQRLVVCPPYLLISNVSSLA